MVKYYTLEEAARILQLSPDKLREMANRKEIRAFQDRGTLRFRTDEIDERARALGQSDPDVPLGEAKGGLNPSSGRTPNPGRRSGLRMDDEVPLGKEKPDAASKPSSRKGPASPPPTGDSDVRLVLDSNLDFNLDDPPPSKPVRRSKLNGPADSDVRLPDEDVPLGGTNKRSPSDSDIRLDDLPSSSGARRGAEQVVTEEIDLDAEERRLAQQKPKPRSTQAAPPLSRSPGLPTSSPFELSEPDVGRGKTPSRANPHTPLNEPEEDSLSELPIPFDESKRRAGADDEDVDLGGLSGGKGASGINLGKPRDSGISLEGGGSDELEFDLPLDDLTPSGKHSAPPDDSDSDFELTTQNASEFELTLDDGPAAESSDSEFELSLDDGPAAESSDSEFELSLDEGAAPAESSDSEFELTLDGEGGSGASLDSEEPSGSESEFELTLDQGGDEESADGEEKDIFEPTNFDVPALDDESASEVVALDEGESDLESSEEFDLSGEGEESGAEVDLDTEEDVEEGDETVAKPRKAKAKGRKAASDEELDLDVDEEEETPRKKRRSDEDEEEDEDEVETATAGSAEPVVWGPLPAILLIPTVVVLFLVGLMSFELVQGMWGYHRPNKFSKPVIDSIARMFDEKLPKD